MTIATRPPLHRLLVIDRMIRDGSFPNARSAAGALEVHPRTIHRDLDFLRTFWGAPLAYSPERHGFYYHDPDYALPMARLSEGELVALFLAERLLQQYHGTPYAGALASLFHKLAGQLGGALTVDLNHLRDSYSFRQVVPSEADVAVFGGLARAVQECRQLELVYWTASRNQTTRRVVDPYHLASVSGEWYLVAYCHLREEVRMFVPARIQSLRETGRVFERPADFSIAGYLDGTFRVVRGEGPPRRVRLQFSPEAARYVREKVWHPSQQLRERKDGSLTLTLKVTHLLEVKRWALSWGAECEVLEPEELRAEMREELRRMAERLQ